MECSIYVTVTKWSFIGNFLLSRKLLSMNSNFHFSKCQVMNFCPSYITTKSFIIWLDKCDLACVRRCHCYRRARSSLKIISEFNHNLFNKSVWKWQSLWKCQIFNKISNAYSLVEYWEKSVSKFVFCHQLKFCALFSFDSTMM